MVNFNGQRCKWDRRWVFLHCAVSETVFSNTVPPNTHTLPTSRGVHFDSQAAAATQCWRHSVRHHRLCRCGADVIKNTASPSVDTHVSAPFVTPRKTQAVRLLHPVKWLEIKTKIRYRLVCQISTIPSVPPLRLAAHQAPQDFYFFIFLLWNDDEWCFRKIMS